MNPKILVVDDDMSLRKMLEAVLTDDGYDVKEADDGQHAIEFVEEQFYDLYPNGYPHDPNGGD